MNLLKSLLSGSNTIINKNSISHWNNSSLILSQLVEFEELEDKINKINTSPLQ